MPETVTLSRIYLEDLDIGVGTRDVRLFDGSIAALTRLGLGVLPHIRTTTLNATNAATLLTASSLIRAGERVLGVTIKILTGLGTSLSLSGISIGDTVTIDRWGTLTTLTANTETDQGDFLLADMPIYPANNDVVISATGGTFDGTGAIQVTVHYMTLTHRSAA